MKALLDAGLIACRRNGQFVYSTTVPETLNEYTRSLTKIARGKKKASDAEPLRDFRILR
jgi:hypothetical protein